MDTLRFSSSVVHIQRKREEGLMQVKVMVDIIYIVILHTKINLSL